MTVASGSLTWLNIARDFDESLSIPVVLPDSSSPGRRVRANPTARHWCISGLRSRVPGGSPDGSGVGDEILVRVVIGGVAVAVGTADGRLSLNVRNSLASVTRGFTHRVQTAVFTMLAVVLATIIAGCGSNPMLITLVVRVCALQGSDLANAIEYDRNMAVRDEFQTINKNIWNQAQIYFLACCQDIPVVRDLFPDTSQLASRVLGSAALSPADRVSDEMNAEAGECAAAWAAKNTVSGKGIPYGPVVVYVHDITDYLGVTTDINGVTSDMPNPNTNLCVEPRQLTSKDVTPRFSFVIEPSGFGGGPEGHTGRSDVTLAHELGHQLLLFHGDGLDAQGNAAPPSGPGPRLFDQLCDPGEREYGQSLMDTTQYGNNPSTKLTQYQIELAREAASVWPGHSGPFPSPS